MRPPKHPRRPPRLERLFSDRQPFYFITFNTYKRRTLLARPEVHDAFQDFCVRGENRGIAVGPYVLMPDHVHLFVFIPEYDITLERWVQNLRSILGKILLNLRFEKPHWQEGFFDHLLRSSESYSEKWEYVRMNPVRAGLTKTPQEWPYQGEIMALPFE